MRNTISIIIALSLPILGLVAVQTTNTGCEVADCVWHSDCASNEMCMDGDCIDPNAGSTGGSSDSRGDTTTTTTGGGGMCEAYSFEADGATISEWECDPIETPIDAPPYPLDPLDVVPVYHTVDTDEAFDLYDIGVCQGGGSSSGLPDWGSIRMELAASVYQQCRFHIDAHPVCMNLTEQAADDLCTDAAALYYMDIGSVPGMKQLIPGMMTSAPCTDAVELSCGGAGDSGSGG